jgi:EAL domain-containing protein (putative c-di-GMP-specific phosphodiesterase class I)
LETAHPSRPAAHGANSLCFQARLSLASGVQTGLETLVRGPTASPRQMAAFGGRVLMGACREAASWPRPWEVSVGIAPSQVAEGILLGQVAAALEATGINPERLQLAFPESALLEVNTDTLLVLSAIRDLGAGIGVDDFGSGMASLALLRRLPLSAVKLGHALVRNLPEDREDAAIVRALIEAAHAIGLTVVAAGIESIRQRAFLVRCGCDEGQGELFGGSVPAEALRTA